MQAFDHHSYWGLCKGISLSNQSTRISFARVFFTGISEAAVNSDDKRQNCWWVYNLTTEMSSALSTLWEKFWYAGRWLIHVIVNITESSQSSGNCISISATSDEELGWYTFGSSVRHERFDEVYIKGMMAWYHTTEKYRFLSACSNLANLKAGCRHFFIACWLYNQSSALPFCILSDSVERLWHSPFYIYASSNSCLTKLSRKVSARLCSGNCWDA